MVHGPYQFSFPIVNFVFVTWFEPFYCILISTEYLALSLLHMLLNISIVNYVSVRYISDLNQVLKNVVMISRA